MVFSTVRLTATTLHARAPSRLARFFRQTLLVQGTSPGKKLPGSLEKMCWIGSSTWGLVLLWGATPPPPVWVSSIGAIRLRKEKGVRVVAASHPVGGLLRTM